MKIRLLFIPNEMPSHIIPLIALAKKVNRSMYECAFLLPKEFHEFARKWGFHVLDLNFKYDTASPMEIVALQKYKPDVVIDDLSYTTAFSLRFIKKPRISIVRKGILPFESITSGYKHSSQMEFFLKKVNDLELAKKGLWQPKTLSDLFIGDVNIIPSIPSIEILPPEIQDKNKYKYAGPLILDDDELMSPLKQLHLGDYGFSDNRSPVDAFLNDNKDRKIALFTNGLAKDPEVKSRAEYCIGRLLNEGVAVITNILDLPLASPHFFAAKFLPMRRICSRVQVMIHHCGSGTYNYQILHKVPAIIFGNRCYDRDDIARRLQEVGAAFFIPAELPELEGNQLFENRILQLLDPFSEALLLQRSSLDKLHTEMLAVQKEFNFEKIVNELYYKMRKAGVAGRQV